MRRGSACVPRCWPRNHCAGDLVSLSLNRVLLHPDLPQHPEIQQIIAQARKGAIQLRSHFATCSDSFWKRIVVDLPRAKDYS